jgi:hypothetical protein
MDAAGVESWKFPSLRYVQRRGASLSVESRERYEFGRLNTNPPSEWRIFLTEAIARSACQGEGFC